jgi:hypothetical protein
MRDAAGQLPDRLHFLRLAHLVLGRQAIGDFVLKINSRLVQCGRSTGQIRIQLAQGAGSLDSVPSEVGDLAGKDDLGWRPLARFGLMDEQSSDPCHVPSDRNGQRRDDVKPTKGRRVAGRIRRAIFRDNGFAGASEIDIPIPQGIYRQVAARQPNPTAAPDRYEFDLLAQNAIEADPIRAHARPERFDGHLHNRFRMRHLSLPSGEANDEVALGLGGLETFEDAMQFREVERWSLDGWASVRGVNLLKQPESRRHYG